MDAYQIKIDSLMSREVIHVDHSATVQEAARVVATQSVSCVVVLEKKVPVGVVTERDLATFSAITSERDLATDIPVTEIMGTPLITVRESDTLSEVLQLVDRLQIRHIPVVTDADELAGVVTQSDLLRACRELILAQTR